MMDKQQQIMDIEIIHNHFGRNNTFVKGGNKMKEVRIPMSEEEYQQLKTEASSLCVSPKLLMRDRIFGVVTAESPLWSAKILADEIAALRSEINHIVKTESTSRIRIYEDNLIRLESSMNAVETMVATYISNAMKEAKKHGSNSLHAGEK